jgi:hypothetical protein
MEGIAYDTDNKPIKCGQCDKLAVYVAYGDDSAIAYCLEHWPKMEWQGDLLKERPVMASDFWIADERKEH